MVSVTLEPHISVHGVMRVQRIVSASTAEHVIALNFILMSSFFKNHLNHSKSNSTINHTYVET